MNIFMVKTPDNFLAPYSEYDERIIDRLGAGEVVRLRVDKERDPKHHARFFAFLRMLWLEIEDIQKYFATPEYLRLHLLEKAGAVKSYTMPDGRVITEVASIAFDQMDDLEFNKVFSDVLDYVLQTFLHEYCRDDLDHMLEEVLRFEPYVRVSG